MNAKRLGVLRRRQLTHLGVFGGIYRRSWRAYGADQALVDGIGQVEHTPYYIYV